MYLEADSIIRMLQYCRENMIVVLHAEDVGYIDCM